MGKIVVIEGTDCSGKETQANLLIKHLTKEGYKVGKMDFPQYNSPTGKIVGGAYLGKGEICNSYFTEGAINVDAKVASLYYAADRRYHLAKIKELLCENDVVILDRYTFSNMAHQGGKIHDEKERNNMYKFLEILEFELLELPRPDKVIFLYMPFKYAEILKKNRTDLDEHEKSKEHLINAERTYLELSKIYGFDKVNCVNEETIKSREDIEQEVYTLVKTII